jgi:hypothetical protein
MRIGGAAISASRRASARTRSPSGGQFRPELVSLQLKANSGRLEGSTMTVLETVALYYDAWQNKQGDFSEVPLAEDFQFAGPVASFDSAEGYRAMAREAGQAVTSFDLRRQFVDGNTVCSIVDWEMALPGVGRMTAAELLDIVDGVIVRGELIYDAEPLRRVMAQSAT